MTHSLIPPLQLYNTYADPCNYYDICLLIFETANHRNGADITSTWQQYIDQKHHEVENDPNNATQQPYEAIVNIIRSMSQRLKNSETTFNPLTLIPMIERYALENHSDRMPRTWVVDLFIQVQFPFETILSTLQSMWLNDVAPFRGQYRMILADHMLYTCEQWYRDCQRRNQRPFGTEENAEGIGEVLGMLVQSGLRADDVQRAQDLGDRITREW